MKRAVIFDVDHTLVDGWSGQLFTSAVIRQRPLRPASLKIIARRISTSLRLRRDAQGRIETGVSVVRGMAETQAIEIAERCFADSIHDRLFSPGISEVLRHRRDPSVHLVLASGSSRYIVEAVGAFLAVDACLGSSATVDESGRISGRVEEPLCFGTGKYTRVKAHLEEHDIGLSDATFYTDSETDLPLLEAVGRAIVVNPSPALQMTARARGWQEERWQSASSRSRRG